MSSVYYSLYEGKVSVGGYMCDSFAQPIVKGDKICLGGEMYKVLQIIHDPSYACRVELKKVKN